jgi:hypothetical protein
MQAAVAELVVIEPLAALAVLVAAVLVAAVVVARLISVEVLVPQIPVVVVVAVTYLQAPAAPVLSSSDTLCHKT